MLDCCQVHAPWQRRLWHVGLLTSLQEAHEASFAVRDRALGAESFRWFRNSLRGRVSRDPGVGDSKQKAVLQDILRRDIVADSVDHRMLGLIVEDVRERYLQRWEQTLSQENHGFGAERVARALAGHLLDAGRSQDALHRWLSWLTHHDQAEHDAASIVARARELDTRPRRRYQVLVLLLSSYPETVSQPRELLLREDVASWMARRGATGVLDGVPYEAGLILRVAAHDQHAAAERAGEIADALMARAAVGTRSRLVVHPEAYVRPNRDRLLPLRRRRRVDVRALERQDRLVDNVNAIASGPVDAALQLLAHLDHGPPEAAATSGWSAIESLLTGPGDTGGNVVAADRLAALLTCAWPRAELTTLAHRRISAVEDELTERLKAATTNRDKSDLIAAEIRAGNWLKLEDRSDEGAVHRLEQLFKDPASALTSVRGYAGSAFRRLYRQRNLVAHGALTSAIALRPSLRTVAPLVGAGMDRIVHAYLVNEVAPLELAARAELEIQRAGSADATDVTALLERD
jgi:hypothetical protein